VDSIYPPRGRHGLYLQAGQAKTIWDPATPVPPPDRTCLRLLTSLCSEAICAASFTHPAMLSVACTTTTSVFARKLKTGEINRMDKFDHPFRPRNRASHCSPCVPIVKTVPTPSRCCHWQYTRIVRTSYSPTQTTRVPKKGWIFCVGKSHPFMEIRKFSPLRPPVTTSCTNDRNLMTRYITFI
jgi:hypothetical protein